MVSLTNRKNLQYRFEFCMRTDDEKKTQKILRIVFLIEDA
jgi:hypothetical protein